ncbi:MAG: C39 family peptidase [Roseiflexaceae bacterium]
MKRLLVLAALALLLIASSLLIPNVRNSVRALLRPEPPPRITPLALVAPPTRSASPRPSATTRPTPAPPSAAPAASITPAASATPTITPSPAPSPTPEPVVVNGRVYDAYIPAATKDGQAYQYSCEFDAAWVILQTYGYEVSVDALIQAVGVDDSVEPFIEQTRDGFVIHGGDITTAFSGNYKENFLARSTGEAMRKAFERYGLPTAPVHDRAGVEAALRSGALVWIKTTVDFKPWRPATWLLPDGRTRRTVLGNDHAVVVIGFNADSVVIRDVLGPTSTNRQRPYEYEVDWPTFLAAWEAQEFDGLVVSPPAKP